MSSFALIFLCVCCSMSDLLLSWQSTTAVHILTAAPSANGFLGARGIMGHIPAAYTYLAGLFLSRAVKEGQDKRVHMYEYARNGYTYHAKGLWYVSQILLFFKT